MRGRRTCGRLHVRAQCVSYLGAVGVGEADDAAGVAALDVASPGIVSAEDLVRTYARLAADQVVPGAPYEIRASDLRDERVIGAIERTSRPCRINLENQLPMFPDT